jgi:DNA polymerase III subunit beta
MEFTGNRNDLAEAITHAANGIPANPVVPVYAGMCVQAAGDTVYFVGSDGDSTFTSLSACKVDKGGVFSLPGKLLSDIVKSLPDNDITFSSTSGGTVTITCGRSTFKLQSYRDPYPGVPKDCDLKGSIPAEDFISAVKAVIPAASKQDANPALHGRLLDPDHHEGRLNVVATDRYRVAVFEAEFNSSVDMGLCIIPPWVAERFRKSITDDTVVSIGWNENLCTMKSGNFTLTTRQIAGRYVEWRKFFLGGGHDVQLSAEGLLAAVRRAQLTTEVDDPVELRFVRQELFVEAGDTNKSQEVLQTYSYNKEFAALFGFQYLIDGLTGCDEDEVRFGFTESLKPVNLSSGRFLYTILPRRRT